MVGGGLGSFVGVDCFETSLTVICDKPVTTTVADATTPACIVDRSGRLFILRIVTMVQ